MRGLKMNSLLMPPRVAGCVSNSDLDCTGQDCVWFEQIGRTIQNHEFLLEPQKVPQLEEPGVQSGGYPGYWRLHSRSLIWNLGFFHLPANSIAIPIVRVWEQTQFLG